MVCNCGSSSVNWSNKIKKASSRARGNDCKDDLNINEIVVAFQTNSDDDIAPAVVVSEDDDFLDVNIIHSSGMVSPAIISKEKVQSVILLGEITDDPEEADGFDVEEDMKSTANSLMSNERSSVDDITVSGMYL